MQSDIPISCIFPGFQKCIRNVAKKLADEKTDLLKKSLRPENSRRFFIKKFIYLKCKFISKVCIKLIDLHTYLLHSVTVTDCNCTVILRLEVISDTERSTDLILSAVTFTDISTVIVLTVVLLGKLLVSSQHPR